MPARRTSQVRDVEGKYKKNVRCERCGANLGQLDENQYELTGNGQFICLDCAEKLDAEWGMVKT